MPLEPLETSTESESAPFLFHRIRDAAKASPRRAALAAAASAGVLILAAVVVVLFCIPATRLPSPGDTQLHTYFGPRGAATISPAAGVNRSTWLPVFPEGDLRRKACPQVEGQMQQEWKEARRNLQACAVFPPGYPNAGGPGCPCPCPNDTQGFGTVFWASEHQWPPEFITRMKQAAAILQTFGKLLNTNVEPHKHIIHTTLVYHCCLPYSSGVTIAKVLREYPWTNVTVHPSRLICENDLFGNSVVFVLLMDEQSSADLAAIVERLEAMLEAEGLTEIPRKFLDPFHFTLARANGTSFPCDEGLEAVRKAIPVWDIPGGLTLIKPSCIDGRLDTNCIDDKPTNHWVEDP